MSYDDGRLGREELATEKRESTVVATESSESGPLRALLERVVTHVREWPGRYVEQQAAVYEGRQRR